MSLLTKSKFKLAYRCPTKLYYDNHPDLYANKSVTDPFLQALADGGFQVAALAKCYYPATHVIDDGVDAVKATSRILKEKAACIHEAAFQIDNFFVRTDILCKVENKVKLIEVKAKSYGSGEKILAKNGVSADWKEYVYDLTFQYWVVKKVHPEWEITPYLLLLDKEKNATVEGLYQMFPLIRNIEGNVTVISTISDVDQIGENVFFEFDASWIVQEVLTQPNFEKTGKSFEQYISELAELTRTDKKVYSPVGRSCKGCAFVHDNKQPELLSGVDECWQNAFPNLSIKAIQGQKVFEVNNWKSGTKSKKYFLEELEPEDIDPENTIGDLDSLQEMSSKERQWQQVRIVKEKICVPIILREGLKEALSSLKYPFNFIDFETFAPPLPFNKGRRPYEMLAFQFSHHILYEDGTVVHANEWINTEQGLFPNFEFVRNLKAALEANNGTVFRYSNHENTVLNVIKRQLDTSTEPDKAELISFISTVIKDTQYDSMGERNMIDLYEMVKKYYIHPIMKGSNSLKVVLPAMLNSSEFLQDKYTQPVYGSEKMKSLNYSSMVWVREDDSGLIMDPYKLLDPLLDKYDEDVLEVILENVDNGVKGYIGDGGAAMMAYAEMQSAAMSELERKKRIESLKKYCELDTLAMVMVMEGFINSLNK